MGATVTTAFLFPGQGEQRAGMLHRLPAGSDDLLAAASEVIGSDVALLDDEPSLRHTYATQIALLVAGTAWSRAVTRAGAPPDYVAGHSVGLWAAAVCAEAIDFTDAVRLVSVRATQMARSSPGRAGMIAVDGLRLAQVEEATARAREGGSHVWASNVNSPSQVAVSGDGAGLDTVTPYLREAGARRLTRIPVDVAAHTPLMQPAEDAVARALARVTVRRPVVPVAGNVTGQTLFTADRLRVDLARSITHGVRWDVATQILAERGVRTWVQVPPGQALLRLTPGGRTLALDDTGLAETIRILRTDDPPSS